MSRVRAFSIRLRSLFFRRKLEEELEEELRAHLEFATEENLRRGLPPDEARHAARRQFGGVEQVKEAYRDRRGLPMLETLFQDLRYAARMMARNPGFTVASVLTLALGIGANTAIFGLMDAVMLRLLPVHKAEELELIGMRGPHGDDEPNPTFTNPLWEQIRDRQDVFGASFAWCGTRFDLEQGGEARYAKGLYASGQYFSALGVGTAAGRLLAAGDDKRGCPGAAVLSYGFWQRHYGGAASAVGSEISLNRHPFRIVGVSAPGFYGVDIGDYFDVAVPVCAEAIVRGDRSSLDHRSAWWLNIMGRRKPGISREQVAARLGVISPEVFEAAVPQRWKPEMQEDFRKHRLVSLPGGNGISSLRREYDRPLRMLMAAVALVLLIACANIASLMLARSAARGREIAIRLAVGASRMRLVRQLLTECVLLSACGGLLGILLAQWGNEVLLRSISSSRDKVFLDLSLGARTLAFTAGIAVLTGLLFGVLPAFRSTRVSLSSAMKGGETEEREGRARFRLGRGIVAIQVALSLVLLVGAGLFARTFSNLLFLDPGFDRSNVLLVDVNLKNAGVAPESREALLDQIRERLQALPGAVSTSRSVLTPVGRMTWNDYVHVEGANAPTGDDSIAFFNFITPGYFGTLRTPLLQGRDFRSDDTAGAPRVAVVNETFARKFFRGAGALGKDFRLEDSSQKLLPPVQIVGVVRDAKYQSLREEFLPSVYFPAAQNDEQMESGVIEIRTAARPSLLVPAVRDAVKGVNKSIVMEFGTLGQQVDDSLRQERLLASLSGFFGALGLLLTVIGLYGVMAYLVTRRRKEIGIRMALGAGRRSILRLILGDVGRVLAAGVLVGAVVSLAAVHFVQKLLFGLAANDLSTLLLAAGVLCAVGLLAGYVPARRAALVDPMAVLREE